MPHLARTLGRAARYRSKASRSSNEDQRLQGTIKIDRSFISGLGRSADDDAIVTATLAIARALELTVVAEGTEAQRKALIELGCAYGQGFHFAAPMPAQALTDQLHAQRGLERSAASGF